MKTFKLKVITTFTNVCEIQAETLDEAKQIALQNNNCNGLDFETEIVALDGPSRKAETWDKLPCYDRAWRLNEIISHMNDEEAYYGGWLYIWPDGETYSQCVEDFDTEENYKELEESFIRRYSDQEFHEAGLYSFKTVPQQVVEDAHMWDEVLNLSPIKILGGH